jgi:hypothetical protein
MERCYDTLLARRPGDAPTLLLHTLFCFFVPWPSWHIQTDFHTLSPVYIVKLIASQQIQTPRPTQRFIITTMDLIPGQKNPFHPPHPIYLILIVGFSILLRVHSPNSVRL